MFKLALVAILSFSANAATTPPGPIKGLVILDHNSQENGAEATYLVPNHAARSLSWFWSRPSYDGQLEDTQGHSGDFKLDCHREDSCECNIHWGSKSTKCSTPDKKQVRYLGDCRVNVVYNPNMDKKEFQCSVLQANPEQERGLTKYDPPANDINANIAKQQTVFLVPNLKGSWKIKADKLALALTNHGLVHCDQHDNKCACSVSWWKPNTGTSSLSRPISCSGSLPEPEPDASGHCHVQVDWTKLYEDAIDNTCLSPIVTLKRLALAQGMPDSDPKDLITSPISIPNKTPPPPPNSHFLRVKSGQHDEPDLLA